MNYFESYLQAQTSVMGIMRGKNVHYVLNFVFDLFSNEKFVQKSLTDRTHLSF